MEKTLGSSVLMENSISDGYSIRQLSNKFQTRLAGGCLDPIIERGYSYPLLYKLAKHYTGYRFTIFFSLRIFHSRVVSNPVHFPRFAAVV